MRLSRAGVRPRSAWPGRAVPAAVSRAGGGSRPCWTTWLKAPARCSSTRSCSGSSAPTACRVPDGRPWSWCQAVAGSIAMWTTGGCLSSWTVASTTTVRRLAIATSSATSMRRCLVRRRCACPGGRSSSGPARPRPSWRASSVSAGGWERPRPAVPGATLGPWANAHLDRGGVVPGCPCSARRPHRGAQRLLSARRTPRAASTVPVSASSRRRTTELRNQMLARETPNASPA